MTNIKFQYFRRNEVGSALLPTVLLTGLMIVLLTSISVFVSRSGTAVSILKNEIERNSLIESALNFGMAHVLSTPVGNPIVGSDRIRLDSGDAKIQWRDETARLNINFADENFLTEIFLRQGVNQDQAKSLSKLVIGRRGLDPAKPIPKEFQIFNNRPLGPYRHITDLLDVPGMSTDLFHRVSQFFTVYGNSPTIDPRIADENLISALPEISTPQIRELIDLRGASLEEASRKIEGNDKLRAYLNFNNSTVIRFRITIQLTHNPAENWDVVTRHFPDDEVPYRILSILKVEANSPL